MSRYHLELDSQDLFTLQMSMALSIRDLETRPFFSFSEENGLKNYESHLALLRRLLEAPKLPEGQASAATAPPSAGIPIAVPVATGAGAPNAPPTAPERDAAVTEMVITPVKAEQSQDGKAMVLTFIGAGNRTRTIRCWDPRQFSSLLASVKNPTTLLVKKSDKGFLNIVGVKR